MTRARSLVCRRGNGAIHMFIGHVARHGHRDTSRRASSRRIAAGKELPIKRGALAINRGVDVEDLAGAAKRSTSSYLKTSVF